MMNIEPIKLTEKTRRVGFRNIISKTYKLSNGVEKTYDIEDEGDTAILFALTSDKKVIVAKQFRPGPEKILFELIAGFIEKKESPIDAIKRELLEETGYTGEIFYAGESFHSAYSNMVRHHFVGFNCVKTSQPRPEDDEIIEVKLLTIKEFKKHLTQGDLSDSETVYRALAYFKDNKIYEDIFLELN